MNSMTLLPPLKNNFNLLVLAMRRRGSKSWRLMVILGDLKLDCIRLGSLKVRKKCIRLVMTSGGKIPLKWRLSQISRRKCQWFSRKNIDNLWIERRNSSATLKVDMTRVRIWGPTLQPQRLLFSASIIWGNSRETKRMTWICQRWSIIKRRVKS